MSNSGGGGGGAGGGGSQGSVVVFPTKVDFYLEDKSTHKRVLTLYNTYPFEVKFKVLCNKPSKYAVVEPEGTIMVSKCTDIVIRHVAIGGEEGMGGQQPLTSDKFRIHMFDAAANELLGKRDILATLYPGHPDPGSESAHHSLPHHRSGSAASSNSQFPVSRGQDEDSLEGPDGGGRLHQQQPNVVACLAAVVCIVSLFLPTVGDNTSNTIFQNYEYLHLTVNQKLVFAYVLGLVTMAVLRMS